MFEEKLKDLRKRKNLSQEGLANLLGVSKQSVYKWERGVNKPDTENLKKMASLFDMKVDDLFNDEPLSEIEKGGVKVLTHKEKKNLKNYLRYMPLFGLITSLLLAVLFLTVLDFDLNIPLTVYILLPVIVYTFAFYLPFKIIQKKRER